MVNSKQQTKAVGAFSLAFVLQVRSKLVPINATLTVLHQYNIAKARPKDALHRSSSIIHVHIRMYTCTSYTYVRTCTEPALDSLDSYV